MIFALSLFNNSLTISAKYLDDNAINIYRNHDDFYIKSALSALQDTLQRRVLPNGEQQQQSTRTSAPKANMATP